MKCVIDKCNRKSEDTYCQAHEIAQEHLNNAYTGWKKAFGKKFTKKTFLATIANDEEIKAGLFAREVAAHLMKSH
jgi:hypothetical protein